MRLTQRVPRLTGNAVHQRCSGIIQVRFNGRVGGPNAQPGGRYTD